MNRKEIKPMSGKQLRALRHKLGLTIQELADALGYSHSSIWKAEHSEKLYPRMQKVVELKYVS